MSKHKLRKNKIKTQKKNRKGRKNEKEGLENVLAYACFSPHTWAATHVGTSRATLDILFLKIDFFSIKRLYFPF